MSRKLGENPTSPTHAPNLPEMPKEPPKPFMQRMLEAMGMPRISDEEFLEKLKAKRADVLRQIAEIEAAREREKTDTNEKSS